MKKAVALVFAALFAVQLAGTAFAGDKKCQGKWQEKRVERLTKDLSLTAEQQGKITSIFKENDEKHKAEMEKMREAMKAEKAETDQKIQAILTPEQNQKFETMKAERQAKMEKMKEKKAKKMGKKMKNCPCESDKCQCPPCPEQK
jgi:Spy/CpxP family protein refolding chaperone